MIVISIISAVVAIFAAIIAYKSLNENRRITAWTMNFSRLTDAERLMLNHPELLRLHGVTDEFLKKNGTTPVEVVYLLASFRAGQEWAHIKKGEHKLSRYRINMLSNKKVVNVWHNILYGRLIFSSPFSEAINDFISNGSPSP
jgi:hypothetical protein